MTSGTDPYPEHPEDSIFPAAGERVDEEDVERTLEAPLTGNATVGDMVDSDEIHSADHEKWPAGGEILEQVERGGHQVD
jgi:hypothetical protein